MFRRYEQTCNKLFEIFHKFSLSFHIDLSHWMSLFPESLTCNFITKHRQENLKVPPVTDFETARKSWWGQLPWLQNARHLLSRTTGFGLSITLCCDSPAWSDDQTALSTPAMLKQSQPPRLPKSAPFDLVHYPPRTTALGCVLAQQKPLDSAIPSTFLGHVQNWSHIFLMTFNYTVCHDIQCSNLVWN